MAEEYIVPVPFPSTWEWEGKFATQIQDIMEKYSSYRQDICNTVNITPTTMQEVDVNQHAEIPKSTKSEVCVGRMKVTASPLEQEESENIEFVSYGSQITLYQCIFCKVRFRNLYDIAKHFLTHVEEKPYICIICNMLFEEKQMVLKHLFTHATNRLYRCKTCGKGFDQTASLKAHIRTHTDERPFKCNVCPKAFSLKRYLKTHLWTHSKNKPFSCNVCNASFAQKAGLNVHLRTLKHTVALMQHDGANAARESSSVSTNIKQQSTTSVAQPIDDQQQRI